MNTTEQNETEEKLKFKQRKVTNYQSIRKNYGSTSAAVPFPGIISVFQVENLLQ